MGELKLMLLSRKYNKNVVNAAIDKALKLERLEREEFWMKRLVTKTPHGLNKYD
jgi:hypothetical protein